MVAPVTLRTFALASLALVMGARASVYLPPPEDDFEAAVRDVTYPIIEWNNELFGITAEDMPHDEWHDANGEPQGTPKRVRAFVEEGVSLWNAAGPQLAALARQVDSSSGNYDYLAFINNVFTDDNYLTTFYRLYASWSSGLGVSEDLARELAGEYDAAWNGAIDQVSAVIPKITRDYIVSNDFALTPDLLGRYYMLPKLKARIEAAVAKWEPVVQYCGGSNQNQCNDVLDSFSVGACQSTADLGIQATSLSIANDNFGFPWTCQAYTDNACSTPVFVPAQPCTLPPPYDVYCQKTIDWNGQISLSGPQSSTSNPSGLSTVNIGSFKCT